MKKLILLLCLVAMPMVASQKTQEIDTTQVTNPFLHDDHFPGGYFLMTDSLPHFMGVFMKRGGMHKVKADAKQEVIIEKQFEKMVKIIMQTATRIKEIETKVTLDVINNGKTAKELSTQIDAIANLRKELTILQIECLNIFKETLTKEQYEMMIELALEELKHR